MALTKVKGSVWDGYDNGQPSSVKDYGAKGDGVTDDSSAILSAFSSGKHVSFYDGSYKFSLTTNPSFSGGVTLKNATVNGVKYDNILKLDRDSYTLVGIDHNHQEDTNTTLGSNLPITSGVLVSPPISKAVNSSGVDILAHWYMDFGSEYVRSGNGVNGALTWYYWAWNNHASGQYDQSRHPYIGWYRGDDAKVLDWQCYWLKEAGVTAVSLVPSDTLNVSTWSTPSDKYYWLYNLFNNAPNFNGLQYCLWGQYTGTSGAIQSQWDYIIDNIYGVYKNCYCVQKNGKLYPVIFCFEGGTLYTNLGGTSGNFQTFASELATRLKTYGYGGVALFVRHPNSDVTLNRQDLEALDVLYYSCDYGAHGAWLDTASAQIECVTDQTTYSAMSASWSPMYKKPAWALSVAYSLNQCITYKDWIYMCISAHTSSTNDTPGEGKSQSVNWRKMGPVFRDIAAIPVSKYAVSPHPSSGSTYWKAQNPSPSEFRKWVSKAISAIKSTNSAPILAIYNVSEWAEGGPGLQPNMKDGFGYLDALREAIGVTGTTQKEITQQPITNRIKNLFVAASSTIASDSDVIRLSTDASRTITSTPTIKGGADGQIIRLMNINASFTVTLQDNATLANSNLFLSAATVVLGPYDSILLEYVSGKGWVQISQTNVL